MEVYRKDVSVIDISLLNLSKNNIIKFNLTTKEVNNTEYTVWSDTIIAIDGFSWTVKPSYMDNYLLRGDLLFLSLLRKNNFKRDLFFTFGFDETQHLNLGDYLLNTAIVDKLVKNKFKKYPSSQEFETTIEAVLKLAKLVNTNSNDEMSMIGNFRYYILLIINFDIESINKSSAKNLFFIMDKFLPEEAFPYLFESWKTNADILREKLIK